MRKRLTRIAALTRKETIQLLRDRRTLAIILITPFLELLFLGYAMDLTVDQPELPIALPFALNDVVGVTHRFPLITRGHVRDIQFRITSSEIEQIKITNMTLSGYLDPESLVS